MNMKQWIIAAVSIFLYVATSAAAADVVEIFYLPHPPAMAVVGDVEAVLKKHSDVKVEKYNFEDPATRKMLEKYHIKNHMPVAVFINGKDEFVIGKRKVLFENFPKGNAFVPMFEGNWSYQDIETVLKTQSRGK